MLDSRTARALLLGLTPVLIAGLAGCGAGADAPDRAPAAAAEPVVVADPATLVGHINFDGAAPQLQTIDMREEPQCAEVHTEPPVQASAVVRDGRLGNVFVYVREGLDLDFPPPAEPAVIDQVGCVYVPRVLGIQVQQDLLVRNSDPLLHNVNARPTANRGFNFSQPTRMESTRQRPFTTAEVMIPVRCDVHGWMNAYIGVVDHPFFAVSSLENGSFEIAGLPAGDYVLEAWHERYGTQTLAVSVGPNETRQVEFTYSDRMAGAHVPLGEPIDLHDHGPGGHHQHAPAPGAGE